MKACHLCTERFIGCHATCKTYKDEVEEDQIKKKAFKEEYYTSGYHLSYRKSLGRYVVKSRGK